ncbi:putative leucine-rich repeat-containing protein DDB_G0290503 isoform X2 [Dysidea avara]|uniref:putative leucine-rich repeat-containing protein DDB_G0290503 isoform X2 n=1 Tax=Dysidea avara TaxID=196820 RepID=UPI00332367CF
MASNRPSIAPGDHGNSPPRAVNNAQQRMPYYDVGRGYVATADDTVKHVRFVIEKNKELTSLLATLTEKARRLEAERENVITQGVMAAQAKIEKDAKEHYEGKLAESLQNYEDAKSVADQNETEIANLKERVQELKAAESAASRLKQMGESLQHYKQKTTNLEQEIGQQQKLLQARSQENNNLHFQIENVAKNFRLSQEQIQLMIQQALNQQQLQSVLYQCDNLHEQLREKNMEISDLRHQLSQFQKLRENNFTSDEDYQRLKLKVEEQNKVIFSKADEIKKKDAAIKGLQEILKKEQQSHQEKMAAHSENSPQYQALNKKVQDLNSLNDKLHNKVGELSQKCEYAETEYAILKSVDLESRNKLQGYKEQVIALEHDLRKSKKLENDLYQELDGALKDLENVSNKYKLLQNENAQLRQQRTPPVSVGGMDDSQLVQELNHKNRQIEIMHTQLKEYADNLDKDKRRVQMLTRETQQLQQQLQYGNHPPSVPPRAPTNMTPNRAVGSTGTPQWDGLKPPAGGVHNRDSPMSQPLSPHSGGMDPSRYNNEGYRRYPNTGLVGQPLVPSYPPERVHTMSPSGHRSQPPMGGEEFSPCPLCGKRFPTIEELTQHAALCC